MNYIIVNNSTLSDFVSKIQNLEAQGYQFKFCYVEKITDPPDAVGGWGGLGFYVDLPTQPLFTSPDVEYRYSQELNTWVANGVVTPFSNLVISLHTYFVSQLEG